MCGGTWYIPAGADRYESAGYRILKIKAGINSEDDLRALSLIRKAVGEDIRLRVDANRGYDVARAVLNAAAICLNFWRSRDWDSIFHFNYPILSAR